VINLQNKNQMLTKLVNYLTIYLRICTEKWRNLPSQQKNRGFFYSQW